MINNNPNDYPYMEDYWNPEDEDEDDDILILDDEDDDF